MKAVYGPVSSWRLGRSLGIDPICSEKKICNFDCVYCQLGKGEVLTERREFISIDKLREDFESVWKKAEADIITFSGTGERTLAKNLDGMVNYLRKNSTLPLAILTNSALFTDADVRKTLLKFDKVVAKLDAPNERIFQKINQPGLGIKFDDYLKGIGKFRKSYSGRFALQIMFIDLNERFSEEIAKLADELDPDEIQINTPLRPCAAYPLSSQDIEKIKTIFEEKTENVTTVYEAKKPKVRPIDISEIQKRKRPKP